jgi:hypothetical protein
MRNNSKIFTSKNEKLIREHFINNFKDDNWTYGGALKQNNCVLVRDLYSNKLKICF